MAFLNEIKEPVNNAANNFLGVLDFETGKIFKLYIAVTDHACIFSQRGGNSPNETELYGSKFPENYHLQGDPMPNKYIPPCRKQGIPCFVVKLRNNITFVLRICNRQFL